ncbi:Uncharacterized protein APZ42_015450 [Daphnia magna]|uniref:Uncharacterized protein n=1 Tax=Daphnia magna TaxID=35525 RepID=A0A162PH08_9CRUS|nr:Uncharacterized protein APZ42_015450 [Daphnia magna]
MCRNCVSKLSVTDRKTWPCKRHMVHSVHGALIPYKT